MEVHNKYRECGGITKLAEEFDLHKIEAELEGAEYNKEKFPGLVYRVKAPELPFSYSLPARWYAREPRTSKTFARS